MKVLPALTDLKNNERCEITAGNQQGALALREKGGISSLHFTRHLVNKQILKVELTCRPVKLQGKQVAENVRLEPFSLSLHVTLM